MSPIFMSGIVSLLIIETGVRWMAHLTILPMELSLLKLQGGLSELAPGERRRRIRHKLHSPTYASFNGPSAGMAFELNELLDLSEEGFAVQAGQFLQINQT